MLKGIQVVYDSITERIFRAPGLWNKYLERFFVVQLTVYYKSKQKTKLYFRKLKV